MPIRPDDALLEHRIIFLGTAIGEEQARDVASALIWLDHEAPGETIDLYINSPGGNIYDTWAIYDAMQSIRCPVATFGFSAMSAAALVLAAGEPGMRHIAPNGCVMIHRSEVGARPGRSDELSAFAGHSVEIEQRFVKLLADHCGQPITRVRKDCAAGRWLDAASAHAYGLVDIVVEPSRP